MVLTESEAMSQGEVESALQSGQQSKAHQFPSLGRQSSIYSLTLDEFQHTLCESGKKFGSMNMDEFLTSIWNAEENQANSSHHIEDNGNNNGVTNHQGIGVEHEKGISKQPSLPRQGSLTLPAPLYRKTVDEVWSEIHREQHGDNNGGGVGGGGGNAQNPESAPRQPTFGEMTLEDFLIKAGVVREPGTSTARPVPIQQHNYLYQGGTNNTAPVGTGFVTRPILGMPTGGAGMGEPSGRNGGYLAAAPPAAGVYGGRGGNGGGAYGAVSPVSSEGMVGGVDNVGNQYGLDLGGLRGRKRIIDGPVEKVVERRQRRMIKNRESAARSRARKQAYTVELEAELNQLKEENMQLKQALAELERKRKQQYFEEMRIMGAQGKSQRAKDKLRMLRRNMSCPL